MTGLAKRPGTAVLPSMFQVTPRNTECGGETALFFAEGRWPPFVEVDKMNGLVDRLHRRKTFKFILSRCARSELMPDEGDSAAKRVESG